MIGPWLTGVIVDAAPNATEGFANAFQVFGIAVVVAGIIFGLLVHPERDRARIVAS